MIAEYHTNKEEHSVDKKKEPLTVVVGVINEVNELDELNQVKEPKLENMERENEEPKKRCCKVSEEVRCVCHCCLRSWSLSLNACEGCCAISSAACIFMSTLAIGCNKCLEQMDCDGH
jgi:hypothetical protein